MDRNYGGLIWTNHALERLNQRDIKQGDAWATWNRPDQSRPGSGSQQGAWVYYRTWGDQKIEVVAKQDENKKWIIISVWADKIYVNSNKVSANTSNSTSLLTRILNLFKVK